MKKDNLEATQAISYLADGNIAYIEQLYDAFLKEPSAVPAPWQNYFADLNKDNKGITDVALSDIRDYFIRYAKSGVAKFNGAPVAMEAVAETPASLLHERQQVRVNELIHAYRSHGHHHAKLDPLELTARKDIPDLHLSHYGFTQADLQTNFGAESLLNGNRASLHTIHEILTKTYCGAIGVEYMHITNEEETDWIRDRFEAAHGRQQFTKDAKLRILKQLTAAEGLERYLGTKYVGQKRFSLEGGISLIPLLDAIAQNAGTQEIKEIVIGMAHRGRLNVLINLFGKSPERLFKEFEGVPSDLEISGDVKYHLGFSSDVRTPEGEIHLVLAFNPSHLEIINPVVEGSVRARQERYGGGFSSRCSVVPVLIHGDAAFAGQGVVMETLNFSQARGFATGGTLHIVVNNQIGFTTSNPLDARSSLYCTDVAKMVQAPIFHVNGDDPEAVVFVAQMALDYRMKFKKDVVIDLVCYRLYGHNEADEPFATQPIMYRKIRQHPHTRQIYVQHLIAEGIIGQDDAEKAYEEYRNLLDAGKGVVDLVEKKEPVKTVDWDAYKGHVWNMAVDTTVPIEKLQSLGKQLTQIPEEFTVQAQVAREVASREKMAEGSAPLNWGFAETLAYASLLDDGYRIRLCGQDSGRGTFAHRHAVLHDQKDGSILIPLTRVANDHAKFSVIDSILSEEAVLGFEYGYAMTAPETLVIWEAQFGDFANGAQVVIDQFISSGEQKWGRFCGLTLLLPHGYEGQGPEHSSARLERYLQLCAQKNMQVCVPTLPSQMFHLLRRQMIRPYRKPLIVFTPKSLLRHKLATSTLEELANGKFELLIKEVDDIKPEDVKKVILCAGKVYYDLLLKRREMNQSDAVILRIEQLYPFPTYDLEEELKRYENAKEVIWCQEEPKNQGAWYSLHHRIVACIAGWQTLSYVGREASASPATGHTSVHIKSEAALVETALMLDVNK